MGERFGGRQKGTPNKSSAEFKALFQKHGRNFVAAILKLTRHEDANIRLRALALAVERGWGKAPQPLTGADVEGPVLARIERVIVDYVEAEPVVEQSDSPEPLVH